MSGSLPDVRGRTVLVIGLGRSGCAAGALLRRHGARVLGGDDAARDVLEDRWRRDDLAAGTAFDDLLPAGAWQRIDPRRLAAVALSPGVPQEHPGVVRLRRAGLPVHGELEWASRYFRGRIVAVTGTNGKSTTTAWIAHVLQGAGFTSPALGNLGDPLANRADTLADEAVPVVECSSFQLETVAHFQPYVGVILNLAPDHLDRYADLAAYYAAKARLAAQVRDDGTFVAWTGCPEALAWPHGGRRLLFGEHAAGAAVWLEDGMLRARRDEGPLDLLPAAELALASPPNLLNALAAAAAALPLVEDPRLVARGLRTFGGLAHRHQLVGRLGGVRFVDDSKGTNVHAVCAGLRGYPGEVVLIAGGRGKGENYTPLREVLAGVRHVVVIGEEGPAIAAAVRDLVPVTAAADLPAAVRLAAGLAAPDATVLLSPACASFDMFRSYRERGEVFATAARELGARKD